MVPSQRLVFSWSVKKYQAKRNRTKSPKKKVNVAFMDELLSGWFCFGNGLLGLRSFFDTGDRAFVDLDLNVIGDFEKESGVFDIGDQTVNAAAGDDAIPGFQVRHQLLMLFLPFLLWTNQQKIEDDSHEKKRQQRLQQIRLGSGTTGVAVC